MKRIRISRGQAERSRKQEATFGLLVVSIIGGAIVLAMILQWMWPV